MAHGKKKLTQAQKNKVFKSSKLTTQKATKKLLRTARVRKLRTKAGFKGAQRPGQSVSGGRQRRRTSTNIRGKKTAASSKSKAPKVANKSRIVKRTSRRIRRGRSTSTRIGRRRGGRI